MADEDEILDGEIVESDSIDEHQSDLSEVLDAEVVEDATQWPVYDAALEILTSGWTPTPLRGKVPVQKRWVGIKPSKADCWAWWVEDQHDGVGIVCGAISGNLTVIDIESALEEDVTRKAIVAERAVKSGAIAHLRDAYQQACAITPSGGKHLFFTITDVEKPPGNRKLSFKGSGSDAVLLVETRGEGGQVAAPPGQGRSWVGDSGPGQSVRVTMAEFELILEAFASVDEDDRRPAPPPPLREYVPDADREPSVADAWTEALLAAEINWADVLDEGWTPNGYDDQGRSLWCRPDYGKKTMAIASAKGFETYIQGPKPVLVVHSTSVRHLPTGEKQRITPFRAWALCFFDGNYADAALALERAVTTGERDPRIVRDIPAAVLTRAKAISATKHIEPVPELQPFKPTPDTDSIWSERDYLTHIRDHARATRTAPDAVLAVTLVRTAVEVGPHVRIPAIVGGEGSLNLYAGLVAFSSGGKSTAISAAGSLHDWRFAPKQLGSGEGAMSMYVEYERVPVMRDDGTQGHEKKVTQHTVSVFAVVDEIDTLTSLSARQGATLMPVLRTMWGGAGTGFGYRDPTKALHVKDHAYRLGLAVGIQPGKAGPLLDEADAGTPQRFIWASTADADAPDIRPPLPGAMPWRVPYEALHPKATVILDVCDTAYQEIDQAHIARLRGLPDAQDGHRLYSQLKVACILGLLDGRLGVNDDDWRIAATIMARSQQTRGHVEAVLEQRRIDESRNRAELEAHRAVHVDQKLVDTAQSRAAKMIGRHVHRHGQKDGCTRKCVTQSVTSRVRKMVDLESAIDAAVDKKWISQSVREDARGGGAGILLAWFPGEERP